MSKPLSLGAKQPSERSVECLDHFIQRMGQKEPVIYTQSMQVRNRVAQAGSLRECHQEEPRGLTPRPNTGGMTIDYRVLGHIPEQKLILLPVECGRLHVSILMTSAAPLWLSD